MHELHALLDGNTAGGLKTSLFTLGSVAPTYIPSSSLGGEILKQGMGLKVTGAGKLLNE
jgi:hypothetical protein